MKDGIFIDLFAGGGGASVGIEAALERPVDVAINHDPIALAVHKANHPGTQHLTCDIWEARPRDVVRGRRVLGLWASPDCTHFSSAKGDVPRKQSIRSLAWVVVRWARALMPHPPEILFVENVPEFRGWGPLGPDGRPDKNRMGRTFQNWKKQLENLGYVVDYRVLNAADFGARTRRKRLFVVARRDGAPIVWPTPTHGEGRAPCRTAAECIDWSIPCPSIFGRKRPLAEKTLWRIAQGIRRFVLENPEPFILHVNHGKWEPRVNRSSEPLSTITAKQRSHAVVVPSIVRYNGEREHEHRGQGVDEPLTTIDCSNRFALIAPTLQASGWGERQGQAARVPGLHTPLTTIMATGQNHALVSALLTKSYGDPLRTEGGGAVIGSKLSDPVATITARDHHSLAAVTLASFRGSDAEHPGCADIDEPMPTISAGGGRGGVHVAEVRAFLTAYYGSDGTGGQSLFDPLRTITTKHRLGIVTIAGADYQITDIGFRMLEPHELLAAQFGKFAESYDLSLATTKKDKIRLIGNSVCPELAELIVRSNLPEARRAAA